MLLVAPLLVLLAAFVGSQRADACSCVEIPFADLLENADYVFRAKVTKIVTVTEPKCDPEGVALHDEIELRVTDVWKGEVTTDFVVRNEIDAGACGVPGLTEGEEFIFQGIQSEGTTRIVSCNAPIDVERAEEVSEVLGSPSAPLPGSDHVPSCAETAGCSSSIGSQLQLSVPFLALVLLPLFRAIGRRAKRREPDSFR